MENRWRIPASIQSVGPRFELRLIRYYSASLTRLMLSTHMVRLFNYNGYEEYLHVALFFNETFLYRVVHFTINVMLRKYVLFIVAVFKYRSLRTRPRLYTFLVDKKLAIDE